MNEETPPHFPEAPSVSEASPTNRRLPRAVWAIIALFLVIATGLQFLVLLDFGPDEPFHVDYAYTVITEGRLPDAKENHIVQHPAPYYAMMGVFWKISGATQKPLSVVRGITSFDKFAPDAISARRLMRFASALFCCLTLWLIARTLLLLEVPDKWLIYFVAWAASWPMLQYVAAVVNNESLAYLYSAMLCFLLVKQWKAGSCTSKEAFFLGLLTGGGALVKQNTLFVVPIALWMLWTLAPERKGRVLGTYLLGLPLLGVWWPILNVLKGGTIFTPATRHPQQPTLEIVIRDFTGIVWGWARALLESAFLPDWSLMFVPRVFETILVIAGVAALLILFAMGLKRRENPREFQLRVMSFVALLLLIVNILQYAAFQDQRAQFGGRYLLNALPWTMVFLATCLPLWATRRDDSGETRLASPGLGVSILLGFLLLIDVAWWFLAWTHYQTQIAAELQRRLVGG